MLVPDPKLTQYEESVGAVAISLALYAQRMHITIRERRDFGTFMNQGYEMQGLTRL